MNAKSIVWSLLWDVGLSVGAYYTAHLMGASDYVALLAGSVVALLRMLWVAARTRRFDLFAGVMLAVFVVGLVLSFLTGDARFLLVKESIGTGVAGLAFLGSVFVGRPLIFHAAQRLQADPVAFEARYAANPGMRRALRFMSAVWGVGLLAEAALRVPLVYLLPTSVAVSASSALLIVALVGLAVWNGRYVARIRARAVAAGRPDPGAPTAERPATAPVSPAR